jgi:hypothetical protein
MSVLVTFTAIRPATPGVPSIACTAPSRTQIYAGGYGTAVTLQPSPSRMLRALWALPCTVRRYTPASPIRGSIRLTPSPASSSATSMCATPRRWGMVSTRSVSLTSIVSMSGPLSRPLIRRCDPSGSENEDSDTEPARSRPQADPDRVASPGAEIARATLPKIRLADVEGVIPRWRCHHTPLAGGIQRFWPSGRNKISNIDAAQAPARRFPKPQP